MRLFITIVFVCLTPLVFGQVEAYDCSTLVDKIKITPDSTAIEDWFLTKNKKVGKIRKSKSDFEIRYYYTPTIQNKGHAIIITCTGEQVQAKKINYRYLVDRNDNVKGLTIQQTDLKPESWEIFFYSLDTMNFYNFPTMKSIRPKMKRRITLKDGTVLEKEGQISDGINYTFEMKIKNAVRQFTYHSPDVWYRTMKHVDELRQAIQIIAHFENNLQLSNSR